MKKRILLFVLAAVISSVAAAVEVPGGARGVATEASTAPVGVDLTAEPLPEELVLHAGVNISVRNREHPLWFYKRICLEDVVPQFLAELKRENPDVEKEIAEKIIVHIHQPLDAIWIYIKGGWPMRRDYARKLAEMALRRFNALDQAERVKSVARITNEKNVMQAVFEKSGDQVRSLDRYLTKMKRETESLRQRLSSHKSQLIQEELKKAELETKLKLLSKKAADVKDAVSAEGIAALEKTAQQLEMQVEEQGSEDTIKRYQMILTQKEREFERVMDLHKKAFISQAEVEKAQFDLEMAKNDYEGARRKMGDLRQRLERVRADLERAKENFAQTGGLALATIIAEKTLECETELASAQSNIRSLQHRIGEVEAELDHYQSLSDKVERERKANEELRALFNALASQEMELDNRIRSGVEISKSPKDYYNVGGYSDVGEEKPGMYEVVGEVKKPGTMKLEPEITVLKAINSAGGFTHNADTENVIVLRAVKTAPARSPAPSAPGQPPSPRSWTTGQGWDVKRHVVDCKAILEGKSPDDFMIKPDDTVIVPSKESAN